MAIHGAMEMYSWILMIFILLTDSSNPVYGYSKCYNQAENASIPAALLCFSNEAYGNRVVIDAFRAKESTTVNCQCTITSATATQLNFSSYNSIQPGLGCDSTVLFQVNGQSVAQNCFVEDKQLSLSSSATVDMDNLPSATSTEYCILVESDAALNISCSGDSLPPRTTTTTMASEASTSSLTTPEQTTETTTSQALTTSTDKQDTTSYTTITTSTTMTQSSESLETTPTVTTVETSEGSETTVNNTTVLLPTTTQQETSNGLSTDTSQTTTTTTTAVMTSTDKLNVNDTTTITNEQTAEGMTTTESTQSVSSETTERETTENPVVATTGEIQTTTQTLTSSDGQDNGTTMKSTDTTTSGGQTTTSTSPLSSTSDATTRVPLGSSTISGGQSTTGSLTTGDDTTDTSPIPPTQKTTTVPTVLTTSRQQLDRGTPWSGIIPAILLGVIIFCALIYAFVKWQRSREIKYPEDGTVSDSRNSLQKDPAMGEINFGYDAYDEGPKIVTEFTKSPETIEMDFSQGELDPKNLTKGTFIRYNVKDYSISNGNASHRTVEPKQNGMDVYF